MPNSLRPHGLQPIRLLCPGDFWSGLPFPSPGDLPNPGIEPWSPALQADSLPTELQGKPHIILFAKTLIGLKKTIQQVHSLDFKKTHCGAAPG